MEITPRGDGRSTATPGARLEPGPLIERGGGGTPRRRQAASRLREIDEIDARCRCLEAIVAHAFRTSLAQLRADTRCVAQVAFARQVAMYVAHVWLALPLTEVGRRFDRDRTTVAHACRVVEDRRDDPRIDRVVSAIEAATDLWQDLAGRLGGDA